MSLGLSRPKSKKDELSADQMDFAKKVLHMAWHPTQNVLAIAALNNLFVYSV